MNPNQSQTPDINAIKQALLARSQGPAMNQGMTQPALNQIGQPTAPSVTGGAPSQTNPQPTIPTPGTPQPQFASPFAGPKQTAGGSAFDEETKKISKSLIGRLLQVL